MGASRQSFKLVPTSQPYPDMNVTEQEFRTYIETFLRTLDESAQYYLPEEARRSLRHLSLLPAHVTGYVSTKFGVAIEYDPAKAKTDIQIIRGSSRVEHLFVHSPRRLEKIGPLIRCASRSLTVMNGELSDAFPFHLIEPDASVIFDHMRFSAGDWARDVAFAEVFADRSKTTWSEARAVSNAKDEVLAALVEYHRAQERRVPISEYIRSIKAKTVLVLGDYGDTGAARLSEISGALLKLGYEPLLIKDFPDSPAQGLPQKVALAAGLARFVVIDDTSASGHLLEVQICKNVDAVTVLLRGDGSGASWMTAGASHTSRVIFEQPYRIGSAEGAVEDAARWAEETLVELRRKFDNTYPWRSGVV